MTSCIRVLEYLNEGQPCMHDLKKSEGNNVENSWDLPICVLWAILFYLGIRPSYKIAQLKKIEIHSYAAFCIKLPIILNSIHFMVWIKRITVTSLSCGIHLKTNMLAIKLSKSCNCWKENSVSIIST